MGKQGRCSQTFADSMELPKGDSHREGHLSIFSDPPFSPPKVRSPEGVSPTLDRHRPQAEIDPNASIKSLTWYKAPDMDSQYHIGGSAAVPAAGVRTACSPPTEWPNTWKSQTCK